MTVVDMPRTEQFVPLNVDWSNPESDLWIATADGEYAGMIEFSRGHFVVTDATGVVLATATSIPAAKQELLADPALPRTRATSSRMTFASSLFTRRTPRTDYRRSTNPI